MVINSSHRIMNTGSFCLVIPCQTQGLYLKIALNEMTYHDVYFCWCSFICWAKKTKKGIKCRELEECHMLSQTHQVGGIHALEENLNTTCTPCLFKSTHTRGNKSTLNGQA